MKQKCLKSVRAMTTLVNGDKNIIKKRQIHIWVANILFFSFQKYPQTYTTPPFDMTNINLLIRGF